MLLVTLLVLLILLKLIILISLLNYISLSLLPPRTVRGIMTHLLAFKIYNASLRGLSKDTLPLLDHVLSHIGLGRGYSKRTARGLCTPALLPA